MGMAASATFTRHNVCNAVSITLNSFQWPIIVGYDSIRIFSTIMIVLSLFFLARLLPYFYFSSR